LQGKARYRGDGKACLRVISNLLTLMRELTTRQRRARLRPCKTVPKYTCWRI
jgi:hypothetical protein